MCRGAKTWVGQDSCARNAIVGRTFASLNFCLVTLRFCLTIRTRLLNVKKTLLHFLFHLFDASIVSLSQSFLYHSIVNIIANYFFDL